MLTRLTTLALADGVHLLAIGALVFFLRGPRPLRHAGVFFTGLIATHLLGGVLLLVGWGRLAWSPPAWWVLVEWGAIAVVLALLVARIRQGGEGSRFRPPSAVTVPAVLLTGVAVSLADLAFDLPYHFAAARIVDTVPTMGGRLAWLVYFNVVYALPMLAAATAFVVTSSRVNVARVSGRS